MVLHWPSQLLNLKTNIKYMKRAFAEEFTKLVIFHDLLICVVYNCSFLPEAYVKLLRYLIDIISNNKYSIEY